MRYAMGQNGNDAVTVEANGRQLTPQELEALQNAAAQIGGGIQRGLSLGVAAVAFGSGLALGWFIWGRGK